MISAVNAWVRNELADTPPKNRRLGLLFTPYKGPPYAPMKHFFEYPVRI